LPLRRDLTFPIVVSTWGKFDHQRIVEVDSEEVVIERPSNIKNCLGPTP